MPSTKPTLAFFGATGGVASTTLALALRDGYTCTALVRNPTKLTILLSDKHSLPEPTLSHLTLFTGNTNTPTSIAQALTSPLHPGSLVDTIIFSIGGAPKTQLSLTQPFTIDDPHVCESGICSLFSALDLLQGRGVTATRDGKKPLLVVVSSVGISPKQRDVPVVLNALFKWMLAVPHADKKKMEKVVFDEMAAERSADGEENGGDGRKKRIRDFVMVRPPMFKDGKARGFEKVRAGWEWGANVDVAGGKEKEPGPMMGWTIDRADVGEWVFRRVLERNGEGWEGKCVTLCY